MRIKRKRHPASALSIARQELRNVAREKRTEFALYSILVLCVTIMCIGFLSSFLYTGYVSYLDALAGTITKATVTGQFPTDYWHGLHGLALRVPGYTQQIFTDVNPGEISSIGVFLDCIQSDATGGREIYISNESVVDFNNLVAANATDIDAYLGCSGKEDCADNTFTESLWVMVGSNNITNVPGTYTRHFNNTPNLFDIGVLKDGSTLVFFAHLTDALEKGYSNNVTANFQVILPVPPNSTERYYFFADPNDECPAGSGIGDTITINIGGYVNDTQGNFIENATVILVGNTTLTDSNGLYNISASVISGTYTAIVRADGYKDFVFNRTFSFTNLSYVVNVTLEPELNDSSTINPTVSGYVNDTNGNFIGNVTVLLGAGNVSTDSNGFYSVTPSLVSGNNSIVAYKAGYQNYYAILELIASTSYTHNITLGELPPQGDFTTGPYTEIPQDGNGDGDGDGDGDGEADPVDTLGEDNWVSSREIYQEVRQNTFIREPLAIYNFQATPITISFAVSDELDGVVELEANLITIPPQSLSEVDMTFYGIKDLGDYNGTITLTGDLQAVIPTFVKIIEKRQTIETLLIDLSLLRSVAAPGGLLKYKVALHNLLSGQSYDVLLKKYLTSIDEEYTQFLGEERVEVKNSVSFLETVEIPENLTDGEYQIKVDASYLNYFTTVVAPFNVRTPIYLYSFFGIPLWLILSILGFFSFCFLAFIIYRREMNKRKRYRNTLDFGSLPKKEDHSLWLGNIAESKHPAYLQLNNLSTHAIVAGATGGGKSISAQVIVKEVLKQNVAVVVFDPTAQWSGMLRKNEDKKMMSFYPKFKLKPTDARSFPGSIRLVTDSREIVDVSKAAAPGQIQVYALNKLEPKDMDVFVANVIRQIFRSDPKESPDVKVMIVFDEVHRLLAKFGGSGEGFLQIERACREFRKWGIGVMLVSQVLSDFVGEIKANINTEVQMRTIEENDLERIKTKYGPEFLKSLVKSEVGVGMIQNAEYNNGKPYFLQFRPILHSTRRLSDEELQQYNDYNLKADQIDFEIEELEKKKIDVFDLKMELKLVKDKIMTGNFSVVDIYLQGLRPRLDKQWQKLGVPAPKMQKKLADLDEIKKSVEEAKKSREEFEKKGAAEVKAAAGAVKKTLPPGSAQAKPTPAKVVKPGTPPSTNKAGGGK